MIHTCDGVDDDAICAYTRNKDDKQRKSLQYILQDHIISEVDKEYFSS